MNSFVFVTKGGKRVQDGYGRDLVYCNREKATQLMERLKRRGLEVEIREQRYGTVRFGKGRFGTRNSRR